MGIINKYKAVLIVAVVAAACIFLVFFRLYHHDVKALRDFSATYEIFDKAISDFSAQKTDDLDSQAGHALVGLKAKAVTRLSSLTKNDAELMGQALAIADLSGKELESLRAYINAIQSPNADLDGLAKECGDLTSKRKTAYVRYRELAGSKY
jgi:hypothetical protein